MKKFRNSRDDGRFALNTLQNPTLEVRSLHQLIAAAEQSLAEDDAHPPAEAIPDAPASNEAPLPEEQLSPEDATADHAPVKRLSPKTPHPRPETPLECRRITRARTSPTPQASPPQIRALSPQETREKTAPHSRSPRSALANSPIASATSANASSVTIPIAQKLTTTFSTGAIPQTSLSNTISATIAASIAMPMPPASWTGVVCTCATPSNMSSSTPKASDPPPTPSFAQFAPAAG